MWVEERPAGNHAVKFEVHKSRRRSVPTQQERPPTLAQPRALERPVLVAETFLARWDSTRHTRPVVLNRAALVLLVVQPKQISRPSWVLD